MTESADALVVFGITGDLARRMTLPALYRLTEQELLTCSVLAVGRRPLSDDDLAELARDAVQAAVRTIDEKALDTFISRLKYIAGDVADAALYDRLREELGAGAVARLLPRDPARLVPRRRRGAGSSRTRRERAAHRREAVRHRPPLRL